MQGRTIRYKPSSSSASFCRSMVEPLAKIGCDFKFVADTGAIGLAIGRGAVMLLIGNTPSPVFNVWLSTVWPQLAFSYFPLGVVCILIARTMYVNRLNVWIGVGSVN